MNARRRARPLTKQGRSSRSLIFVAPVIIGVVLIGAVLLAPRLVSPPSGDTAAVADTDSPSAAAATAEITSEQAVEVPDVSGTTVEEARIVLDTVGFDVRVTGDASRADSVIDQDPGAGTVVPFGSTVALTAGAVSADDQIVAPGWVVVIDPGHQRRSDMTPEAIGPGAKETKPRVTGGATGVETGLTEYEVVLQISTNLRRQLEEAGVKVVMTRTTNDVNIANSERAAIANGAGADLFVRIHCDGSPDSELSGISTLYPAAAGWTKSISSPSKSAARNIQKATLLETGAVDRGVVPREDLSGFNYSKVPAVLVECGFMSHPIEDRLLSSPHYQDKLASGIRQGILAYLSSSDD